MHPEKNIQNAPIGIFDSGIGGLTVAAAVARALPHEQLIYFGDTAHLPYGDKSQAAIQAYAVKICDVLLKQGVKAILIACNSASAAAFELAKEYVASKAIVVNVIDPVVQFVAQHYAHQTIGLIGTKQTIYSNVYKKKIDEKNVAITLRALATPLLAPMIEAGFFENKISHSIIEAYLSEPDLQGISALILGCTHYPLIQKEIEGFYNQQVDIIDSAKVVADFLAELLRNKNLLRNTAETPSHQFFVSDYTTSFENSTKLFFGEKIELLHYPLWE
jgi:glutamate racemase